MMESQSRRQIPSFNNQPTQRASQTILLGIHSSMATLLHKDLDTHLDQSTFIRSSSGT